MPNAFSRIAPPGPKTCKIGFTLGSFNGNLHVAFHKSANLPGAIPDRSEPPDHQFASQMVFSTSAIVGASERRSLPMPTPRIGS